MAVANVKVAGWKQKFLVDFLALSKLYFLLKHLYGELNCIHLSLRIEVAMLGLACD